MNLSFKILWVEDNEEWVESIEDSIKQIVEDEGFEYSKKLIEGKESDIDYKDFDLVLMDYKLSDTTGDEIIENIRNKEVLTDVIFYSSNGVKDLKQSAADKGLEGVYFSDREKIQFLKKVHGVIECSIRKVQDLNNLRGLVMAEVSELDAVMDDIVCNFYTTKERMEIFHKHITENRETTLRKALSCENKCQMDWHGKEINEIIKGMDSSQKARAIHQVLKELASSNKEYKNPNFYSEYESEIISVRNNLAHCKSMKEGGNEVLKTRKGDKTFSNEDFKRIREDIRKYHNLFNKLLADIK